MMELNTYQILQNLNLYDNRIITDNGIKHLSNITNLSLCHNKIITR